MARLQERFGAEEIAVTGDRGMIKALGKRALSEAHFRYVTALTDPQGRRRRQRGVRQLEWFEKPPGEVWEGAKRYVRRGNPAPRERVRARRADPRAPVLSLGKAVRRRLKKPRQDPPPQ